jgi:hypothetical protein
VQESHSDYAKSTTLANPCDSFRALVLRLSPGIWRAVKEVDPSEEISARLRELFFSEEQGVRCNVAHSMPDYLPAKEARDFLMAEYERATDKGVRECIAEAMNKIEE